MKITWTHLFGIFITQSYILSGLIILKVNGWILIGIGIIIAILNSYSIYNLSNLTTKEIPNKKQVGYIN